MTPYEAACAKACSWCAKRLAGERSITNVLEQSRPNPMHKIYPPHVLGPFSEYLPCTAPTRDAFEQAQADRIAELERENARLREELTGILEWEINTPEKERTQQYRAMAFDQIIIKARRAALESK